MDGVTVESVEGLHKLHGGPFVRHQLTEESVRGIWRLGEAVVVDQQRDRHGTYVAEPVLYCLGTADELRPLLAHVAERLTARPARVSIEAHAEAALPPRWQHAHANRWDAMWTDAAPPRVPAEDRVVLLHDDAEVDALLDRANPDTHGRPGDPGMQAWVGVRADDGQLVAAGALSVVVASGVAHLRGVSTLPAFRGRGLGTAVSARLTRMGFGISDVVTLGAYTDNAPAIALYRRLGYHHDRSWVSGPLRG